MFEQIINQISSNDPRITQVAIGVMVLLLFVVALFLKRKKRASKTVETKTEDFTLDEVGEEETEEVFFNEEEESVESESVQLVEEVKKPDSYLSDPERVIQYITPAEYIKKCINAVENDTLSTEIAQDFFDKLYYLCPGLRTHYTENFYAWMFSTFPLLRKMKLNDNQDICRAITILIYEDISGNNVEKLFSYFITEKYSSINISRASVSTGDYTHEKSFQKTLNASFLTFMNRKKVECPECLENVSSVLSEGNETSLVDCLTAIRENNMALLPVLDESEPGVKAEEIAEEDNNESESDDFFKNVIVESESNDDAEERLKTYSPISEAAEDPPDEDETKDSVLETEPAVHEEEERPSPPPDTFTLSVDPEDVSNPCEKNGKILRRVKIPNKKDDVDKLRDSIIVYGDQIEDTGEGFMLLTLPSDGRRTLYKTSVVAMVYDKPVYKNEKEVVSNLEIKDRFNDYYVASLGKSG